jgi:hypothetical protein
MALIAKSGTPSLSAVLPPQNDQFQLVAGEAIAAGDLCYIASDGTAMRSNGTSANAAAKCVGIAAMAAPSGEAVTVYRNVRFHYGTGLTPGAQLYVGATAGRIDNAATTGGTAPIGFVVDATRVFIHGSTY